MIELIGKNGSGKTFIANELGKRGYNKIVGYTTRKMRENEVDKVDYNFITKDEFEKMIKMSEFIDYKVRHDNYYGISKNGITNNSIIVSGNSNAISASTGFDVYKLYLDVDMNTRFERMLKRNSDENLFERIHLENFSFLNDFKALFINNTSDDLSIIDYIESKIQYGIISDNDLIDNRLYMLYKIKEYESSIHNSQNFILDILEYEEYLLRKLSLGRYNDKKLVYYKAMRKYLDNMNIEYINNNDTIDLLNNNKIYNLEFKER